MATVFIPAMLRSLAGGATRLQIAGTTVRAILDTLEERFPGFKERLLQDGDLRPDIAVAVDGEFAVDLIERVRPDSEVHFVPPISGGV